MQRITVKNKNFYKDGKLHYVYSGAIHYFRVLPSCWRDRLEKIKNYTEYMSDIITTVKDQTVTFSEINSKSFDLDELVKFAKENDIYLTVVGPEDPLTKRITDKFKAAGLRIFGPDKKGAELEGSKSFSKAFM